MPRASLGAPTTPHSATAGWGNSAASISGPAMLYPAETIMSSDRATHDRRPLPSAMDADPVSIPAMAPGVRRPQIREIAASGRAANRKPADGARRQFLHVIVDDLCLVT